MIENKNEDFTGDVEAPIVIYNGVDLSTPNKDVTVNEDDVKLRKVKSELLQKLRTLLNNCKQINEDKANAIKAQLNSRPVSIVLSKKRFK